MTIAFSTLHLNSLRPSVSKWTIIGSDNGLSPGQCQAIIWTNFQILLIRTLGKNFSEIFSEIHIFSFKNMHLKMSATWHQFCLGLNVLKLNSSSSEMTISCWTESLYPTSPITWLKLRSQGISSNGIDLFLLEVLWPEHHNGPNELLMICLNNESLKVHLTYNKLTK